MKLCLYCISIAVLSAFTQLAWAEADPIPSMNVAELARLLEDVSATGSSFKVSVRIAYVIDLENDRKGLSLFDSSGYAFATTAPLAHNITLRPGDNIIAAGVFVPTVAETYTRANLTNIVITSSSAPHPVLDRGIEELLSGSYDLQPSRVHGILRDIRKSETNPDWLYAVLVSSGSMILVAMPAGGRTTADFERLVGAEVCISGICNPRDGSFRLHQGRIFQCNGLKSITPVDCIHNSDPFASPRVEAIRFQTPEMIATLGRHIASGLVLATWVGRKALVEQSNGTLVQAEFDTPAIPRAGESIEVAGFPESDLFHIHLTRAVWRHAKDEPHGGKSQRNFADERALFGTNGTTIVRADCHGRPVLLNGIVRSILDSQESCDSVLHLETHGRVIPVHIPKCDATPELPPVGSIVSVSGTCVLMSESWSPNKAFPQITGFLVATDGPSAIRTIESPPWWTLRRMTILVCTLLSVITGIMAWNFLLQKAVARRARELFRAQIGQAKADLRTEERTRLAVELHDSLSQNLTGVSMEIEAANDLRGNAPKQMTDHLDIAARILKSCRDELRNCLWDLRSQAIDEPDMTHAILRMLQPSIANAKLTVRFDVPRSLFSDNTAHALLRTIRELVVNAIRHGKATQIRIAGAINGGRLLCSVSDNGCGFVPESSPGVLQGHFGLQGVRERIREFGGGFTIKSAPGQGTKAVIELKVHSETTA